MKNAFTYDFRVYTLPEVREAMREAGFKKTYVWYATTQQHQHDDDEEESDEGNESDGDAVNAEKKDDGIYFYVQVKDGEKLLGVWAWNAYVIGVKH